MKKSIFIPLLFISIVVFSQGSKISFDIQNGRPVRTDTVTSLRLPLTLVFSDQFNSKHIKFLSEDGTQPLALNNAKFGSGELNKDGETNQFIIIINEDKSVNPGDEKINFDKFILQLDSVPFSLALAARSVNSSNDQPKNEVAYKAGYVYYDAIKLTDLLKSNPNNNTIAEILKAYGVADSNVVDNPYLNDVLGSYFDRRLHGGEAAAFLTNLGNTDVTYFAAGLARFLAERTKAELNEAFFSRMKDQLNTYPELKTAFPKTVSYLDQIETFSYASILNSLKDAFEMDIQNLPENLYNIKSLTADDCDKVAICGKDKDCDNYTECQARLKKLSEFFASQDGRWVALGMLSVKDAIQTTNPADLIKTIAESEEFSDLKTASAKNEKYDDYNIVSSFELGNLISQSLISKDDQQIWITKSELNTLLNSGKAFKVYLGLLLSKELSAETKAVINFYKSDSSQITIGEVLKKVYKNYKKYGPQVNSLIKNTYAAYNVTNNAIKNMLAASEKSTVADPRVLYDYYTTITSSLKPVAHNPLLIEIVGKDIGASYDRVENYLTPSVDIAYHISTKKYSAAIYDASVLLSAMNEYKIKTTDNEGDSIEEKYDGFKTFTKSFVKYGTLISTVAKAQSSDEVKQALDASVLPVGSYSIKETLTGVLALTHT